MKADDLGMLDVVTLISMGRHSKTHLIFGNWAQRVAADAERLRSEGEADELAFERALILNRDPRRELNGSSSGQGLSARIYDWLCRVPVQPRLATEIADGIGCTVSGHVTSSLKVLERKGRVRQAGLNRDRRGSPRILWELV